jgi:hypothetical protein
MNNRKRTDGRNIQTIQFRGACFSGPNGLITKQIKHVRPIQAPPITKNPENEKINVMDIPILEEGVLNEYSDNY